jgi:YgiT-type zinc finger domain-containing protein
MTVPRLAHRCPSCGGKKEPGTATFTADFGVGVVVVRDVPAIVCSQCGAEWIDDAIAEKLEKIVERAREKKSLVEVTRMTA